MKTTKHEVPVPRQAHGLLTQQINLEVLVYHESTHQAFCLNPVAAEVWNRLDGAHTMGEISVAASLALGTPVTEEAVLLALAELREKGLLAPEPAVGVLAGLSRRDVLRQMGAGALAMLPAVAVVMAPKAAQAYNGCVNCNAVKQNSAVPVAPRKASPTPEYNFIDPGTWSGSTQDHRKKRKENGEIWVP